MHDRIRQELHNLESEHDARVLYACESGSRAWGFESADSDFDPRFVYVHRHDWYLSIEDRRDVIEATVDLPNEPSRPLDLSGWELRKALRLFRKSNPPIMEWLASPIVYQQDDRFIERLRGLIPIYYSPRRCFLHYRSMAINNFRDYLQGEMVRYKKYLYVLRPVLACLWLEREMVHSGEEKPVPVPFMDLVDTLVPEGELRLEIDELLRLKRMAAELDQRPRSEPISTFIEEQVARLETVAFEDGPLADSGELNRLFREFVGSHPS